MTVARKVCVFGRVQGVFYRQSAINQAQLLGAAGWVRNARDGSVEAHVEGEEEAVAQMLAWMRHGPSQAKVENVHVEEVEPEGLSTFSVKL